MTHAEAQTLLLDLAYGELDPAQAATLEEHLAGCAECSLERAQLDATRKLVEPLRELEEPSPGFDDAILAAARAEASLQSDGTPGQVIEVTGTVRPAGVEAARIDATAPVSAPQRARRPRWALRFAIGGSAAAAATLALVVSTTRGRPPPPLATEKAYEIHINAPQVGEEKARFAQEKERVAPDGKAPAAQDGQTRADQDSAARQPLERSEPEAPRADAPAAVRDVPPAGALAKPKRAQSANVPADFGEGGGGDISDQLAGGHAPPSGNVVASSGRAAQDAGVGALGVVSGATSAANAAAKPSSAAPAAPEVPAAATASRPTPVAEAGPTTATPLADAPARAQAPQPVSRAAGPVARKSAPAAANATVPPLPARVQAVAPPPAAPVAAAEARQRRVAAADDLSADALEDAARKARRDSNYALAAAQYRRAASLRRAAAPGNATAAWDLAHAVECLSAISQFEEAQGVWTELRTLFPQESSASAAAERALRPGLLAPSSSAPPAVQAPPAAKAKARPDEPSGVGY